MCDMENALLRRYNDLAFAVEKQLIVMCEHQSTINPNMPLRFLPYITDTLLLNVFLATTDKIIVVDPMGEYSPLIKRLGGQVVEIAPNSPHQGLFTSRAIPRNVQRAWR